jgi:hypothetical protein
VVIDVTSKEPHSYFPGETYAKITLRNAQDAVIFSKDIQGTAASLSHDELPLAVGDKIEIYHVEPGRVRVAPASPDIIDNKNKTNVLTITQYGLKNETLSGDPQAALLVRLEAAVQRLREYRQAYLAPFSEFKDDIYLAINTFDSSQREQFIGKLSGLHSGSQYPAGRSPGQCFYHCRQRHWRSSVPDRYGRFGEENVHPVDWDRDLHIITSRDVYAAVSYTDAEGNVLYSDEVVGNQEQQARSVVLPISGYGGEVIQLRHEEPDNRLIITNEMQHVRLAEKGKQQSYCLTPVGLERMAE